MTISNSNAVNGFRPPPQSLLLQRPAQSTSVAQVIDAKARAMPEKALVGIKSEDGFSVDSHTFLAFLACCYTLKIYGSAEVAAAASKDVSFRDRCLDATLTARMVRRFRRKNRAVLHTCLVAGLRVQAAQKLQTRVIHKICERSLKEEACRRIVMAMFMDSMELDSEQTSDNRPK
jgi:hypothetical protein